MATIVLGAVGAAAGGAIGGSAFGLSSVVIGRAVGSTLGRVLDQKLMGGGSEVVESGRMDRLRILGASEGGAIPNVFGRMRVSGNVIWSSRFRENVTVQEAGGGKGAPGGPVTKQYSYSVNVAIALCEGEIARVGRVWADGNLLSLSDVTMRVYTGAEDQLPDPVMSATEGEGNVPAYRGLAYVVFEDLELGPFGNRIPQLSFEVIRAARAEGVTDAALLSDSLQGVAMIPGTGEYALATTPIYRDAGAGLEAANVSTAQGVPDFELSLEQLNGELPKVQSASLIVSWFGDDLRVGECRVLPKVENPDVQQTSLGSEARERSVGAAWTGGSETFPWIVSGVDRANAEQVSRVEGRPIYGGTPSDGSVVEAIQALHASGKAVTFYPFILMEILEGNGLPDPWSTSGSQPVLPWRGRITTDKAPGVPGTKDRTSAARDEVARFMGQASVDDFEVSGERVLYTGPEEYSYRRFILHYAHLCKAAGGVDSFCIGSEMRALTQIRDDADRFPAVEALRELAAEVRSILGPHAKIGYASDWSEYFGYRPADGSGDVYFHLDPLWADDNIDFIGVDNYMPISDWRDGDDHADASAQTIYNLDYLRGNISGGEGYDWYYADEAARASQTRTPIEDGAYGEDWIYRYKDFEGWWSNRHYDRRGGVQVDEPTAWVPKSKPFWFTEFGCAAVDKGTNQPNKFIDPKSSESDLPHFSDGSRDDLLQLQYLRAYLSHFADPVNNPVSEVYGGSMVDMSRALAWAWDARPWPDFPNNDQYWSDGPNYLLGHWLNGRTGVQPLAHVVAAICEAAGLTRYDVSGLYGIVRGFSISEIESARASLQPLMVAYGFDAIERGGVVHFRNRNIAPIHEIDTENVVVTESDEPTIEHIRSPEAEVVGEVRLSYVEAEGDFAARVAQARFPGDTSAVSAMNDISLALSPAEGRGITERWLSESRVARDAVRLSLPPSRADVAAGDLLRMRDASGTNTLWRVDRIDNAEGRSVEAVRMERQIYRPSQGVEERSSVRPFSVTLPIDAQFMDLPLLRGDEVPHAPYVAATARPWPGSAAIYSSSLDSGYTLNTVIETAATMGRLESELRREPPWRWARGPAVRVKLSQGALRSATPEAVLNGGNVCAVGDGSTGNWEVMQFSEARLVAPMTYELSGRLRGQAGTDGIMPDLWPVGSRFVLLNGAAQQIEAELSARGLDRHFRVGPALKPYDNPAYRYYVEAFDGIGLRPYAPTHLRSTRRGGDLDVRWVRRTRIDGDSWASVEVPLGEDSESYMVRILRDGAVLREQIVSMPQWTYGAEQRAADGDAVTITVAQISQSFGLGPFERIEFND